MENISLLIAQCCPFVPNLLFTGPLSFVPKPTSHVTRVYKACDYHRYYEWALLWTFILVSIYCVFFFVFSSCFMRILDNTSLANSRWAEQSFINNTLDNAVSVI